MEIQDPSGGMQIKTLSIESLTYSHFSFVFGALFCFVLLEEVEIRFFCCLSAVNKAKAVLLYKNIV